ncbi:MAG TPA: glutathione S-transferase family protein [Paenalcaligenes sp.]|nr:glutathione S-transferase family protein [Paenalcaligenes sp.]
MSMPYELIDTQYSGNAWKVRLLSSFLNIPLQRFPQSIVDGDLNHPDIKAKNPLQRIPILKTRSGKWLSESGAILWYLAQGSSFLPKEYEADIVYWLLFEQLEHMPYFAQPRLQIHLRKIRQVTDPDMQAYRKSGHCALKIMEENLSEKPYLVSEQPTIADVALYPYTQMADEGGYELTSYPAVLKWLSRIQALPGYIPIDQV